MSLRVLTLVWDRYPGGGSQLLTMLALADWANDNGGRIYPSMATLAGKIRMSERQAKRITDKLISDGYLENQTPRNRGGALRSNRYRIRLEKLAECPVIRSAAAAPESDNLSNNPDIAMSDNPDIAMSDNPLDPLNTVSRTTPPDPPGNARWNHPNEPRLVALRSWLAQLEKLPEANRPPGELDRVRAEIDKLEAEKAEAEAQAELFDTETET